MNSRPSRWLKVAAIAVVAHFIAFNALCWFLDLTHMQLGKMNHQDRYWLFLKPGAITGLFALLASVVLCRSHRWLAVIGLLTCLLWAVWAALPRL